MSKMTVADFANELHRPARSVLEQLQAAGVAISKVSDELTDEDKQKLLTHLQTSHGTGAARKKITLTKRSTSQIRQSDATGKARTIDVHVRKKRTFVRRESDAPQDVKVSVKKTRKTAGPAAPTPAAAPAAQPLISAEEQARRDEGARRQAELMRLQAEAKAARAGEREASHTQADDADAAAASAPAAESGQQPLATAQPAAEQAAADAPALQADATAAAAGEPVQEQPKDVSAKTQRARPARADRKTDEQDAEAEKNRREAIAEAEAIREMMRTPRKTLVAKKSEEEEKPRAAKTSRKDAQKEIKSANLSSSWAPESRKKRIPTRGDSAGGRDGWRSRRRKRHSDRDRGEERHAAPVAHRAIEVHVPETITVAELAHKMAVKASEVIKRLMGLGQMVTINQPLDQDTAMIVVEEFGNVAIEAELDDPEAFTEEDVQAQTGDALPRPPVVTVMGHVDHGKTSLLDYIRRSKVAGGEAGGITQHIGAYHVQTKGGIISFLDTPGHEAFTAMRARGAQATDIVILVVAADDGVMPQTREAVKHAKAAGVPIVVAVNKMDKPEANLDRIKGELAAEEVVPEDFGGDSPFVPVSAKTGQGMDELLEQVLLQAEVLELKAPVDAAAKGIVIEARLDRGRGPVATVLVQSGTLNVSDTVLVGQTWGRVRAMLDENSESVESAGPSIPVEIQGLDGVPQAGDDFLVLLDERRAREIATYRAGKFRHTKLARQQAAKLQNMFSDMEAGEVQTLPIVLKADVQGSQEALAQTLLKLSTDEVQVQMVYSGVGGISESDINLAIASNAVVIGFNTRADAGARKLAENNDVEIHYYDVIYDAVEDLKAAMSGMLAPEKKEEIIGMAEVRNVFVASRIGTIAGSMVTEGMVRRDSHFRLLRDNVVIYTGQVESLRRIKDDVAEVKEGFECGIKLRNYTDVKEGDQLEFFTVKEVARTL
ncbi:MAG: translation initiation factor IF-2 [Ottowia sp.]|nr:translation initiation factor IF-2 [Ottowia sp.]